MFKFPHQTQSDKEQALSATAGRLSLLVQKNAFLHQEWRTRLFGKEVYKNDARFMSD